MNNTYSGVPKGPWHSDISLPKGLPGPLKDSISDWPNSDVKIRDQNETRLTIDSFQGQVSGLVDVLNFKRSFLDRYLGIEYVGCVRVAKDEEFLYCEVKRSSSKGDVLIACMTSSLAKNLNSSLFGTPREKRIVERYFKSLQNF